MQAITVLFDLDGVIIDTEPQYDIFWRKIEKDYQLGIENFEHIIKGTTTPDILKKYFSHLSVEEQNKIADANFEWEKQMDFIPIPGALEFIENLKKKNIKIGLVTSSDDQKLKLVFKALNFDETFDTVVSADRITIGKPHPMCYLLAAKDLNSSPEKCIVFEDSFQGIEAGNAAGMRVIGLSTTNPEESIKDKVNRVIPNFEGICVDDLI